MTMPPPSAPETTPLPAGAVALLQRLAEHQVEHVLIGSLAAAAQGYPWTGERTIIVPARFARNLDRLAGALRSLGARWRDPTTTAIVGELDVRNLHRLGEVRLATELGELDVDFEPPATAGHLDLFEGARRMRLAASLTVEVASAVDLLRIAEMRRSPDDDAMAPWLRSRLGQLHVLDLTAARDARGASAAR